MAPITTALGEIYMFELGSNNPARSLEELRTIVEWQVGPRLRQVPGVVDVVGYGGEFKQYQVTIDPSRLTAHGISIEDVRHALEHDNRVSGGGYVETSGESMVFRADARYRSLEDIQQTVVRVDAEGVPVTIAQLGNVTTGRALRHGAVTRDGRGEIVGASIWMLKGANSREVVKDLKAAIEELRAHLPADVTVDVYYDRADFIDRVLTTIAKNLGEGAVIVVVCLLLTLGSLRAGLLVAGAIPFSMLVGIIGLQAIGYTGNVMSLGAVDFGIIVEGAVLSVEHAMTKGASIAEREQRRAAIVSSLQEVTRPAAFGVIITLLVFLPLATLEDVEGKMFRPVVFSLCFMLVGALIYAFLVLPAIAPGTLRVAAGDDGHHHEPKFVVKLRSAYRPLVERALRFPKATVAICFGATVALLTSAFGIGADFLPRVFEGAYNMDALRPPSTSVSLAVKLGKETEEALKEAPEVVTVVNRIGRPENAIDPQGTESSDVFVILKPRGEWRKGLDPDSLAAELTERVDARVPMSIHSFAQPIETRVNDLIAGAKSDVVIKVFGDDLSSLVEVAERMRRKLASVPGAVDVKSEMPLGLPAASLNVDRAKLARLGIPASEVLDLVAMSRAGITVGTVREEERVFDLVLRVGGERVETATDLGRLPIATANGALVPVSLVTSTNVERTIMQIGREQMRRRILVQCNVRGRDLVGFVNEAQTRLREVEVPRAMEVVWGGQFQNFTRAKDRLAILVPVALAVIAVMLFVTFRSLRYTVVTLLNLPFAIAGGFFALRLRGLSFSIPAGVGFVALCGVSVITGIVMTTNLLRQPSGQDGIGRVREAALASFRARISTALIAAIGFVPAAIATGTGAEVQRPLATVVIGGLAFSMVISLVALPAMLLLAEPRWSGDVEALDVPEPEQGKAAA